MLRLHPRGGRAELPLHGPRRRAARCTAARQLLQRRLARRRPGAHAGRLPHAHRAARALRAERADGRRICGAVHGLRGPARRCAPQPALCSRTHDSLRWPDRRLRPPSAGDPGGKSAPAAPMHPAPLPEPRRAPARQISALPVSPTRRRSMWTAGTLRRGRCRAPAR